MTEKELLEHNKKINKEIEILLKAKDKIKKQIFELENKIKAPCEFCPLDGVYRCEACSSERYAGFKDRDWF